MANMKKLQDEHRLPSGDYPIAPHVDSAVKCVSPELPNLMQKWQAKLKLNHWKIDYELCDRDKMGANLHGKCKYYLDTLRAEILFGTESDYNKGNKGAFIAEPYNLEETVVHELMHIILAPMRCNNEEVDEQTVNILTRIILEQDRQHEKVMKELHPMMKIT